MLRLPAVVSIFLRLGPWRGLWPVALCAALLVAPRTASGETRLRAETEAAAADVREFSVQVHAPPSCVDSTRFTELIVKRTKRAVATTPPSTWHFVVTIHVAMDGATGELTTIRSGQRDEGTADAARTVRAATCHEAAEALALIAAVILDPAAALEAPPQQKPAPEPGATPAATTRQSAPPPSADWRVGPGVAALFMGGVGPGASTGFTGFFGVAQIPRSGVLALDARIYFAMTPTSTISTPAGRAELDWWSTGLTLCPLRFAPEMFRGAFALEPCAGFEGGLLKGTGSFTHAPSTSTGIWLAATVGLRGVWSLTEFFRVEIAGDLVIPIRRDRFFFAPDVTAYQVPVVTGRGTIGVALLF